MQSRWRALLACRGLCEPLEAAQFGFCGAVLHSFAIELYSSPRRAPRVVTHSHQSLAEETRTLTISAAAGLGTSPRVMSSMHR